METRETIKITLASDLKGIDYFNLGKECESKQNYRDAISHYINAVKLTKHPIAMNKLGINFFELPKQLNEEEFLNLLTVDNFDANRPDEKNDLVDGLMQLSGLGVEKNNFKEGIKLLLKSARNTGSNNFTAQWLLANIILNFAKQCKTKKGLLFKEAYNFIKLSADQGDSSGQCFLGVCYEYGMGVHKDLEKAFENYTLSANQGDPKGQCCLGSCYQYGIGVHKNPQKAFENYTLSANQGDPKGQCCRGFCYERGIGVGKDPQKAFENYTLSANQGDPQGQRHLGFCYEYGIGVGKDPQKAFENYTLSANQGDSTGQWYLGSCYEYGIGVSKDLKKAFENYTLSANQGNPDGQHFLGLCYANGDGVVKDVKKAAKLLFPSYFRKDLNDSMKKKIKSLIEANDPYLSVELKKLEDPIGLVKSIHQDTQKSLFSLANEYQSLLADERISDTILKDQISIDIISACFYDAACNINQKEQPSKLEQYQMMVFLNSIPSNSIFYPFALDLLSMIVNQQYANPLEAWENDVRSYRESIRRFLTPYCGMGEIGENQKVSFFLIKKRCDISAEQQKLLESRQLRLNGLHQMNNEILREMNSKMSVEMNVKKRKRKDESDETIIKEQKIEKIETRNEDSSGEEEKIESTEQPINQEEHFSPQYS